MAITKQLNIKNRTCYFYNDLINLFNFHPNMLKLDKKYLNIAFTDNNDQVFKKYK